MLDGHIHAHRSRLDVRVLHRASLVDMAGDALLELVGVLVAQSCSGGVDFDLFVESDVGVVVGVIGAVDNDFRAFALAQRVFDGELA